MDEYAENEFNKHMQGFGKLTVKKFFKGLINKEIDEEKEKNKFKKEYAKMNMNKEQKELYHLEKKEEEETDKEENPHLHIALEKFKSTVGTCRCQVVRSSSNWSTGIVHPEDSIYQAYVDMIRKAKHFIYIENQFFISNPGRPGIVENEVAKELKERIIKAHNEGQDFMVIVFLPLLPGFAGDVTKKETAILKTQIKHQQETIAKGDGSLFKMLIKEGIEPNKYIRFYGLRKHDLFRDKPMHEIIYVHSKLMIVDDRRFIIGSSNINDRSM